jgi:HK97 family phage portal protein
MSSVQRSTAVKRVLDIVSRPFGPRVVANQPRAGISAAANTYELRSPDESLAPGVAEIKDLLLTYTNVPLIFRAVDLIASSAAMVPLSIFEQVPIEDFEGTIGQPDIVDPVQGMGVVGGPTASMGMKRWPAARQYTSTLKTLIKAEVGGLDELTSTSSTSQLLQDIQVEKHPMLSVLRRPNRDLTSYELMYRTYAYMMLTGNCFWVLTRDDKTGDVNGIYVPKPHRIEPHTKDGRKGFNRQIQRNGGETTEWWPYEDIIHFKTFSPVSDVVGMSPIRPIVDTVLADLYAARWNKDFFANSARPDFFLMFKQHLDDATFKRMLQEWNIMYSGMGNTHRPAILEGEADVKEMSTSRKDMEFVQGREFNRTEILSGLGVPPELVGASSEKVGAEELQALRKMFWQDTMMPKLAHTAEVIEHRLFPKLHPISPELYRSQLQAEAAKGNVNIEDIDSQEAKLESLSTIRQKTDPLEEELDRFAVRYDTRSIRALGDEAEVESQVVMRYVQTGFKTINELRRDQNLPPLHWGDSPPLTTPIGASMMNGDMNEARTLLEGPHDIKPADVGVAKANLELRSSLVAAQKALSAAVLTKGEA